jgi:hypothetical protein
MARRTGTTARFVAVYDDGLAVRRVAETGPGVFQVTMSAARDEISAAPKKFSYKRIEALQ